jgi:FkbM family methyltransferase
LALLNRIKGLGLRWRRPLFELAGSDRYSYLSLNELDRKLKKYLDFEEGWFIEAGANDGLRQSNSYWFERFRGWRGLLIEALPDLAAKCRRNRPRAHVINTALVGSRNTTSVQINVADLMAYVSGAFASEEDERIHRGYAHEVLHLREIKQITVPARTLEDVLDEAQLPRIDLFSLDVEGFELEVLLGMNLARYRPRYLLVESKKIGEVMKLLANYYVCTEQLSYHDYLLVATS